MLLILRRGATFDELSQRMETAGAELTRLESCTFPSRPEARLATWSVDGEPVARYRYEPDIELRWVAVDRPDRVEVEVDEWELFDQWESLRDALHSNVWTEVFRAAAAFRAAAEHRVEEVDGEAELAQALAGEDHTVQAAASQLSAIATEASRDAIERAIEQTKKVETRVDLRRALDRIEMNSFRRR